jgi:hypothetical protein
MKLEMGLDPAVEAACLGGRELSRSMLKGLSSHMLFLIAALIVNNNHRPKLQYSPVYQVLQEPAAQRWSPDEVYQLLCFAVERHEDDAIRQLIKHPKCAEIAPDDLGELLLLEAQDEKAEAILLYEDIVRSRASLESLQQLAGVYHVELCDKEFGCCCCDVFKELIVRKEAKQLPLEEKQQLLRLADRHWIRNDVRAWFAADSS